MTLKEKLLKAFPNTMLLKENGLPYICPHDLGIVDWNGYCPTLSCKDCWNRGGRRMTLKETLLKAFPNATAVDEDGFPLICPQSLGIVNWGRNCPDVSSCEDCWNQEIENEHCKLFA